MSLSSPIPSKDGKKLFVIGQTYRGELMRYEQWNIDTRSVVSFAGVAFRKGVSSG